VSSKSPAVRAWVRGQSVTVRLSRADRAGASEAYPAEYWRIVVLLSCRAFFFKSKCDGCTEYCRHPHGRGIFHHQPTESARSTTSRREKWAGPDFNVAFSPTSWSSWGQAIAAPIKTRPASRRGDRLCYVIRSIPPDRRTPPPRLLPRI